MLFTWVVCAKEWKFFGLSASYGVGDLAGLIWKVVFYFSIFLFFILLKFNYFRLFCDWGLYRRTTQMIVV